MALKGARRGWQTTLTALGSLGTPLLSLAAGVVTWELVSRWTQLRFLPPPSEVLVRFFELVGTASVLEDILRSLQNLALGFLIAAVIGVVTGGLMGRYRIIERALSPYVYALLTAPAIAFIPIYFTLFGLSRWAIIVLIVHYAVFFIILNTVTAVQNVEQELLQMGRSFCCTEQQLVRMVILPAALPFIMTGLRLGMARSVKAMINGELLIAVVGLGALTDRFGAAFDATGVLAVLLIVILIALAAVGLVQIVDTRLNRWLPPTDRGALT